MSGEDVLRREELVERGAILYRHDDVPDAYRRRWDEEAAEDPVRSAIAESGAGDTSLRALTSKTSQIWDRIPERLHVDVMLEIGAGYGRIPLYLANNRGVTWSTYVAVDISENMLRELLRHDERFGTNRQARLYPLCLSADRLPLEDESVDLAISSAVFLHMGKSFVRRALAEIARTLKPGGRFVFDSSFPNARNPAQLPSRLKPKRLRAPNFMKYWTRAEVEQLLRDSGLAAKAGDVRVEPASYMLLPKRIGPLTVPLARRVNARIGRPRPPLDDVLAATYDAYSAGFLTG